MSRSSKYIKTLNASNDYVIVDLVGVLNTVIAYAAVASDFIVVPYNCSPIEAEQANNLLQIIKHLSDHMARQFRWTLLFTRVQAGVVKRFETEHRDWIKANQYPLVQTRLCDRISFQLMFQHAACLSELRDDPTNKNARHTDSIDRAIENADHVVADLISLLNSPTKTKQNAA